MNETTDTELETCDDCGSYVDDCSCDDDACEDCGGPAEGCDCCTCDNGCAMYDCSCDDDEDADDTEDDQDDARPSVRLSGASGNVFAIIGTVSRALKDAGLKAEAKQFQADAMSAGSYDEVLSLAMRVARVS